MNIGVVSINSPKLSTGGTERALKNIFDFFKDSKEHKIYAFLPSTKNKNKVINEGSIEYHELTYLSNIDKNTQKKSKLLLSYLNNLMKEKEIDVVVCQSLHTHETINHAIAINLSCLNHKIPMVLFVRLQLNSKYLNTANSLFWDKIIGVSKAVTQECYNEKVPINKLDTIYPETNLLEFRPDLGKEWLRSRTGFSQEDIVVLMASRIMTKRGELLEEKGVSLILKAFSEVSKNHKNIKLLIASAKPNEKVRKYLDKVIKKIYEISKLNGIENKIKVIPFGLEDMPKVYNAADIFVLPTRNEAFGRVYAEAMACSLPVIGTNVGGVPEIITNNKNGYLVSLDNSLELSKAISSLVDNPKKREKMGKEGLKKVKKEFNLKKIMDRFIGVLNSVICKSCETPYSTTKHKNQKKLKV